jgi:hypothetical protein
MLASKMALATSHARKPKRASRRCRGWSASQQRQRLDHARAPTAAARRRRPPPSARRRRLLLNMPRAAARPAPRALSLLDAVALALAADLIVGALGPEERASLRLAHPALRDAVDARVPKVTMPDFWENDVVARPPSARRWPAARALAWAGPCTAPRLAVLGAERWAALEELSLCYYSLDEPAARALAAAARAMPRLRRLRLRDAQLKGREKPGPMARALFSGDGWAGLEELSLTNSVQWRTAAVSELLRAAGRRAPRNRVLDLDYVYATEATMRTLASTGWALEELRVDGSDGLRGACVARLAAAPTFALRRLTLLACGLYFGLDPLGTIASTPWPLEELSL